MMMFASQELETQRNPYSKNSSAAQPMRYPTVSSTSTMGAVQGAGQSTEAAELFSLYAEPVQRQGANADGTLPPLLDNDPEYLAVAGTIDRSESAGAQVRPLAGAKSAAQVEEKDIKQTNLGMTGIGSSMSVGRFVTAAKKVQADWGQLMPRDRADKFTQAANQELETAGVPAVDDQLSDIGKTAGEFDGEKWKMLLGKEPFGQPQVSDGETADMADTVYHESRHAEQEYRVARLLAGQKQSATKIAKALQIKTEVAEKAATKPLDDKNVEGQEAMTFFDSMYGKNAEHHSQVFSNLRTAKSGRKQAEAAYLRISEDPKSTPEQKLAAEANWQGARLIWKEVYKEYRALPEEADAWKVGAAVTATYLEKK